ncbi:uncharacterized protein LOC129565940 [Sitodiplosis mosellana]|uniref:uncharacterized protein LOC129565940 n=1 Tax=Sitodiplosis mosellana TaxID=263140 RepID=UPI0024452C1E|nr:uncharacterized protein LOC129565940 [Sitodiplosis mosellana]
MSPTKYDADAKEWSGCDLPPVYNPEVSLAQVLLDALTAYGSKIAQINDNNGVQMTFDEIRIKTVRAAKNLQKRGYEPRQVFGLMAKNSHHVAPIVFASISIGCPVNTLDPSFGKTELIHMLEMTKPTLMFCDVECHDLVRECFTELGNDAKIFTFGGSKDETEPVENLFSETHNEDDFIPTTVDGENETAAIVCSSGTTGLSKGVCLSHAALLENLPSFRISKPSDVVLCVGSLYWVSGIAILLRGTICGATRIITTEALSPELQLRLIEKYKVTTTANAPHQIVLMLKSDELAKADLSSLKSWFVGGSKVPFHVKTEMSSFLPNGNVHVGYGISEIGGVVALDFPQPSGKDCVGRLTVGIRVKIIDDQGQRCEVNVDGEICLKVNYRILGYYGNQKATDDLFDDEGFYMTGDIGHFDEDGYLFIVDRKKDILKYCSFQISPSEIDAYLIESPGIKSACVVGIPNEFATDLPAAVIVRANGSNISEKEVFDLIADHFADHYKLRGGVYFVDSLPTTPSGKVLRRKVKETVISLIKSYKA